MSPDPIPEDDAEPSLLHRVVYATVTCAAAAALFVLVSGVHAGNGARDGRLLVAQCWHDIEQKQVSGVEAHRMRVGCQALESGLAAASAKPITALVASQE